ncbi:MAG: DUF190 domain-containing protein [Syntrophobacteraceae bacterium]
MPRYKIIEIYTSEETKWHRRPVHSAVIECMSSLKIPVRTIVTRGIGGAYENGEITAGGFDILSCKGPIHITIILNADYFDDILSKVQEMVPEGIITARDVEVLVHRAHGVFYVQSARVEGIMAPSPRQ